MKVEYYIREMVNKNNYLEPTTVLKEILDFPDGEEGYKKFYHENNSLKYCNGFYYKFVDKKDEDYYYNKFVKKYDTIKNYYGNGIVD